MNEQQLAKKPQLSYTKDQVELVKSQIAPEAKKPIAEDIRDSIGFLRVYNRLHRQN